jgi:nucleoid-associated protein YgaU
MTAASILRIAAPSIAFVVACGAALVFGATNLMHAPQVETGAANVAPVVSPPASDARDEVTAALASGQAKTLAVAAEPGAAPGSPATDESLPLFEIARIERSGDAVIAGRAAPGATVELLRNGERHDRAVAGASGQFVMVPPRLPPGHYELTLRSELPDGTIALSKAGIAVALDDVASNSDAAQSNIGKTASSAVSSVMRPPATATAPEIEPKIGTKVVSRGDSLWRISRLTYGAGTRYQVVYRANREQIRDPERIYPGQIFVLPTKER